MHKSDRQPSFSVRVDGSPSRGSFQCFRCGASGRLDLPAGFPEGPQWQRFFHPFFEVVANLSGGSGSSGKSGGRVSRWWGAELPKLRVGWHEATPEQEEWVWQILETKRGIPRAIMQDAGGEPQVWVMGDHPHLGLMLPHWLDGLRPSGRFFRSVDIAPGSPCEATCSKRLKGRPTGVTPFGHPANRGTLWICEGPLDAASLLLYREHGVDRLPLVGGGHADTPRPGDLAVCTFGSHVTEAQLIRWFLRLPDFVFSPELIVLVPDADEGGAGLARAAAPLRLNLAVPVMVVDARAAFGQGRDVNDYLLEILGEKRDRDHA